LLPSAQTADLDGVELTKRRPPSLETAAPAVKAGADRGVE
jgi:hypothetical protein